MYVSKNVGRPVKKGRRKGGVGVGIGPIRMKYASFNRIGFPLRTHHV